MILASLSPLKYTQSVTSVFQAHLLKALIFSNLLAMVRERDKMEGGEIRSVRGIQSSMSGFEDGGRSHEPQWLLEAG